MLSGSGLGTLFLVVTGEDDTACTAGLTPSQVVVHSVDEEVVHPAVLPPALRRANLFQINNYLTLWVVQKD